MDSKGSDVVGKMYITGMQDILPVNSCNSSFSWILGTHCPALSLPTLLIITLLTYNINWSWKRTNCDLQVIQTTHMISAKNRRQKKIQKLESIGAKTDLFPLNSPITYSPFYGTAYHVWKTKTYSRQ